MIRWLLTTFIAVAILSSCWPWLRKIGIGRMPGDVTLAVVREGVSVSVYVDVGVVYGFVVDCAGFCKWGFFACAALVVCVPAALAFP